MSEKETVSSYINFTTALDRVLVAGEVRTKDLGGRASTWEFTDAVIRALDQAKPAAL